MSNGAGVRSDPEVGLLAGSGATETARVTLRVLGTFEATVDGRAVSLGGPRQRAVLARVLVADGAAVPAEQIVEDVWGGAGGASARRHPRGGAGPVGGAPGVR